jgi:hypothetical protein
MVCLLLGLVPACPALSKTPQITAANYQWSTGMTHRVHRPSAPEYRKRFVQDFSQPSVPEALPGRHRGRHSLKQPSFCLFLLARSAKVIFHGLVRCNREAFGYGTVKVLLGQQLQFSLEQSTVRGRAFNVESTPVVWTPSPIHCLLGSGAMEAGDVEHVKVLKQAEEVVRSGL